VFVHKRHIVRAKYDSPHTGRAALLEEGVVLHGWEQPSGLAAPDRYMFLEVAASTDQGRPFRLFAFLSGNEGALTSWELPMGYDLYGPERWSAAEVFVGSFAVRIPLEFPHGSYALGLFALGADGEVLALQGAGPTQPALVARERSDARMAVGELRWEGAVNVVSPDALESEGEAQRQASIDAADRGACAEGEAAWRSARRLQPKNSGWAERNRPAIARALSRCFAGQAEGLDGDEAVEAVEAALGWDHRDPRVQQVGAKLADALMAAAMVHREARNWDDAYHGFRDVLRVQPTRAWARRYAEEARDQRYFGG
jgi:hypothetical protein